MPRDRNSGSGGVVPQKHSEANLKALDIVLRYIDEGSEDSARTERLERNKDNYREFRGDKDWGHKSRGQSMEHLPKMRMAAEQISAIFKKALVDLGGSWYDIEVSGDAMPGVAGQHLRKLMNMHILSNEVNFPTKISDAVKQGYLESLMVGKVFGKYVPKRRYEAKVSGADIVYSPETGLPVGVQPKFELRPTEEMVWRLAVDLVPTEDYIPDPDGLGLYEIHEVTRDLWQVRELAELGIYDKSVVDQIIANMHDEKDRKRQAEDARGKRPYRGQAQKRKKVRVSEVWSILVDDEGKMIEIPSDGNRKEKARNTVTTLIDHRYMVRAPIKNPSWSGLRPLVASPLIRTPHSVWNDALGDYVRSLNNAIDELFNLMLDAGIKSVWGISQIRPEMLLDEDQISEGIPPQETLILRPGVPPDVDVYKRVDTGSNMGESIAVMNLLMTQFSDAAMVNQIGLGQLPARQVKACVPLNSKALTRYGWKSYHELKIGDDILAVEPETMSYEWTPILGLYKHGSAETVKYKNDRWEVVCTSNHKWIERRYNFRKRTMYEGTYLIPIDEMKNRSVIQTTGNGPAPDGPGIGILEISDLLDRENLSDLVILMTASERQSFIVGMLAGEGHIRHEGGKKKPRVCFAQKEGPVHDAFRLACYLQGIKTSSLHQSYYDKRTGKTYKKRSVALNHKNGTWKESLKRTNAGVQPVWCPQTKYKTWIMKQGDIITATGNTEVSLSAQSMGNLFDGLTRDLEDSFIEPILERAFHLVMQHLNEMDVDEVVAAVGTKAAIILLSLTPEERFAMFANRVKFRVTGLSSMVNRMKEFQKILALLEVMSSNPALGMIFARKYSLGKVVDRLVRAIDIDPEALGVIDDQEAEAQVRLLKTYVDAQKNAVSTGREWKAPELPPAEAGLPGQLPSAGDTAPGSIPPGIEGGGGINEFDGMSQTRRAG